MVSTDKVYGNLPLDRPDMFFTEYPDPQPVLCINSADLFVLACHQNLRYPGYRSRCSTTSSVSLPGKLIPLMISRALADEELPVYGSNWKSGAGCTCPTIAEAIDLIGSCKGKVGGVLQLAVTTGSKPSGSTDHPGFLDKPESLIKYKRPPVWPKNV